MATLCWLHPADSSLTKASCFFLCLSTAERDSWRRMSISSFMRRLCFTSMFFLFLLGISCCLWHLARYSPSLSVALVSRASIYQKISMPTHLFFRASSIISFYSWSTQQH